MKKYFVLTIFRDGAFSAVPESWGREIYFPTHSGYAPVEKDLIEFAEEQQSSSLERAFCPCRVRVSRNGARIAELDYVKPPAFVAKGVCAA